MRFKYSMMVNWGFHTTTNSSSEWIKHEQNFLQMFIVRNIRLLITFRVFKYNSNNNNNHKGEMRKLAPKRERTRTENHIVEKKFNSKREKKWKRKRKKGTKLNICCCFFLILLHFAFLCSNCEQTRFVAIVLFRSFIFLFSFLHCAFFGEKYTYLHYDKIILKKGAGKECLIVNHTVWYSFYKSISFVHPIFWHSNLKPFPVPFFVICFSSVCLHHHSLGWRIFFLLGSPIVSEF